MNTARDLGQTLLSTLYGLTWQYWAAHWGSKGGNFYGDHLLFERLYGETLGGIDSLAERLVAEYGAGIVSPADVLAAAANYASAAGPKLTADPVGYFKEAEKNVCLLIRNLIDTLAGEGRETHGFTNLLEDLAQKHESAGYLLGRRAVLASAREQLEKSWFKETKEAEDAPDQTAESMFFDDPDKRTVRDFAQSGATTNFTGSPGDHPGAQPLPSEIKSQPGGDDFSTLNRRVVHTEQPSGGLPGGWDEVQKHPVLASWRFAPKDQK